MLNYLDIELPDDARQLQRRVRRFVEDEALPLIPGCFEAGRFPAELIPRFAELGLLGGTLPSDKTGGTGLTPMAYGLACQELERGDSGLRSFLSIQSALCMFPIYSYGSEATATALSAGDGARGTDRLFRPYRAAAWLGP